MSPIVGIENTVIFHTLAFVLKLSELLLFELDHLWDVLYPEIKFSPIPLFLLYYTFPLAFLNSVISLLHPLYLANTMNGFSKSRTFYLLIHFSFTTGIFLFLFCFLAWER